MKGEGGISFTDSKSSFTATGRHTVPALQSPYQQLSPLIYVSDGS